MTAYVPGTYLALNIGAVLMQKTEMRITDYVKGQTCEKASYLCITIFCAENVYVVMHNDISRTGQRGVQLPARKVRKILSNYVDITKTRSC